MSTLDRAIEMAAAAHRGQKDRNGEPYILHPLRVMMALRDAGLSERHQIVGILHDVVEDTPITISQVRLTFGPEVGDAVEALTHDDSRPYMQYIRDLLSCPIAVEVKKRDLTDNADFRRYCEGVGYGRYAKAMAVLIGESKLASSR